ncbi:hypothetical protein [Serratia sp. M24T3]|uniref:hypothetical protein n=1 Tax=Serratia sp. M24T3 TaxID=932213 RepID=UPI001ED9096A|nr:hypothetical protein [Serratia sp. M24T3]
MALAASQGKRLLIYSTANDEFFVGNAQFATAECALSVCERKFHVDAALKPLKLMIEG